MKLSSLLQCTKLALVAASAVAVVGMAGEAGAWPDKTVRVIVPFGTGGGTDIQARLLADNLRAITGQSFIVENRSGAGGLIGAEQVVNAPPDGHTLLFTTATLAINRTLYGKTLKFDPMKDLVPSTLVSNAPNVLCVHPSVPAQSVPELIALSKKHATGLNAGVNTPGSTSHLAAEMLMQLGGIQSEIIPYTGGGPAISALMVGEIDYLFATGPVAANALKVGRVRCLAVTTAEPNDAFPDLPPINKFVPGLEIGNWYAMFFPRGTPELAVKRLSAIISEALDDKKIQAFFAQEGLVPIGSTPQELRELFASDVKRYAQVIKDGKIPLR
jgi:tripartite-type tricarboxylate transporter receptor subunit TctC